MLSHFTLLSTLRALEQPLPLPEGLACRSADAVLQRAPLGCNVRRWVATCAAGLQRELVLCHCSSLERERPIVRRVHRRAAHARGHDANEDHRRDAQPPVRAAVPDSTVAAVTLTGIPVNSSATAAARLAWLGFIQQDSAL